MYHQQVAAPALVRRLAERDARLVVVGDDQAPGPLALRDLRVLAKAGAVGLATGDDSASRLDDLGFGIVRRVPPVVARERLAAVTAFAGTANHVEVALHGPLVLTVDDVATAANAARVVQAYHVLRTYLVRAGHLAIAIPESPETNEPVRTVFREVWGLRLIDAWVLRLANIGERAAVTRGAAVFVTADPAAGDVRHALAAMAEGVPVVAPADASARACSATARCSSRSDAGPALVAEAVAELLHDESRAPRPVRHRRRTAPRPPEVVAPRGVGARLVMAPACRLMTGSLRILFVVQRYGRDVPGGAESLCRDLATRLATRGHDVARRDHVRAATPTGPTSTSREPRRSTASRSTASPSRVHATPRSSTTCRPGSRSGAEPVALELQEEWMRLQGPWTPALVEWLDAHGEEFDVAVFVTYLYWTSWAGLRCLAGRVPTVLVPTAHDEPTLRLPLFKLLFALARRAGVPDRGGGGARARAVPRRATGCGARRRRRGRYRGRRGHGGASSDRYGLRDRPYLVVVGRLDPAKGSDELADYFVAYRERNPHRDLALVVVGEPMYELAAHPDVVVTGFVDEATRRAVAGARSRCNRRTSRASRSCSPRPGSKAKPALVQRVRGDERSGPAQRRRHPVPRLRRVRGRGRSAARLARPRRDARCARPAPSSSSATGGRRCCRATSGCS